MPLDNATQARPSEIVERLAVAAGIILGAPPHRMCLGAYCSSHHIERLAQLVAEECAKVCDEQAAIYDVHIAKHTGERLARAENYKEAVEWVADLIRAKFGAKA